ncbi:HAMP domain-containing histidine kinase [Sphingobium sp. PAMC28499]|uniref:sensor histidine kinase n=1 Tax=Sphingobium sp. PAMC28499 TaxID=2565554 RepID=UPI00109E2808|nr:HAMP domain-containing sensor histidine kinase [Sphingobium sp. PAMC28499]QCB36696.1 HAMP domain-containing histidine kinase [Sphingobium sp. PAMC28499]
MISEEPRTAFRGKHHTFHAHRFSFGLGTSAKKGHETGRDAEGWIAAMKLFPRSIRGRLLFSGLFFSGLALALASLSIGNVLDRFVQRGLDERLDAQIALLLRGIKADGTVDIAKLEDIGPFTQHRRGWVWRIETPDRIYLSEDVVQLDNVRPEGRPGREGHFRDFPERLQSGRSEFVYARRLEKRMPAGTIVITAAAPIFVLDRLRDAATFPVLTALGALSVALLVSTILQLHLGLKPLGLLKQRLSAIRSGTASRIVDPQPAELMPIVAELNGLLDENEAALSRSRAHLSNLAHSLKTPLAALNIRLAESGHDPDGQLGELVAQIDGAIRHHLGRARAASPGAPGQPLVPIDPAVAELIEALERIYAEKALTFGMEVADGLEVNCDPQDLAEMLGNLLDNACKWASSNVRVSAREDGRWAQIDIDDDGPGLNEEAIEQALVPGRRLDERSEGHGFGLPIARELVELHGGALVLGRSPAGGLRATLRLPRG